MKEERQPTRLKPHYPPTEFWRALLAFRIYVFGRGLDPHFAKPGVEHEGALLHSVDVVDEYLQVACDEGWLDN
jgi:hypothetical protein